MLNSINSDLIRGHIDTIILSVLREGDRYGYDILGEIEKKSGGQYTLKQPTLYSCLKRLEGQGFIYKYWGTESGGGRRTYYSLTEMGKELFMKNKDEWEHSRGIIDMLISSSDSPVRPYILLPEGEHPDENYEGKEDQTETSAAAETSYDDNSETIRETELLLLGETAQNDDTGAATAENEQTEESTIDISSAAENEEKISEIPAEDEVPVISTENDELSEKIFDELLAEKESSEIMSSTEETPAEAEDQLRGVSYADRAADDENASAGISDSALPYENSYMMTDYFTDYDGEDDDEEAEEEFADTDDDQSAASDSFGNDEQTSNERAADSADENDIRHEFRSYADAPELSEEAQRDIIIQREYRNVIKELLHGEYYGDTDFADFSEGYDYMPVSDESTASGTDDISAYSYDKADNPRQADFSNLLTAVRSMGDEIRIRTHNSNADKEYNSVYQYYSNKLLLYKYGILFLIMAAEILIPYLIIKFAVGITIKYEILTLVLSITGSALLPIYAAVANMIDPYKRKRYDFSLKSAIPLRLAVMALMLVLIYAANVVLFMDIAFDAEYAFSLVTPALLSTNIPLSPIIFQTLYDTKKFNVES